MGTPDMATLFELPIATGGSFVCSEAAPKVYLLSFSSPPDNRLTTSLLQTYLLALDIVEHSYPSGALISTSSISKFFSNGLDLAHVSQTPGFLEDSLYPLFRRLLTYPMPTIALINGHAFAGGLMVAMYHDYRVQNPSKGYLCLNEVLFGAIMQTGMVSIFRQKLRDPATFRNVVLEGRRVAAEEALREGMVDGLGGLEDAVRLVNDRQLVKMGDAGVYGQLKEEMYRETLAYLDGHEQNLKWREQVEARSFEMKAKGKRRVVDWQAGAKAKAHL